jgi:ADP-ribose pyrophosphatase
MTLPDPVRSGNDFTIISKEVAYQGHFQIEKYKLQFRLYSGEWSEVFERELFERGCSVAALLYDPILDQVVLIEQFRVGALQDKTSPWLIELVAGVIDNPDETAEQVVIRESAEEAGLEPATLLPICQYWASPGGSSELVSLFCAKVDASHAGGIFGLAHEHENIRAFVASSQDAFNGCRSGRINNGSTIIALQWLELNLEKVQKEWGRFSGSN